MINQMRNSVGWTIALLVLLILISCDYDPVFSQDASMRVMTFNIRYDNPKDGINAWPNRKDNVADLIKFYEIDLLGVQEAVHGQMIDLQERLPKYQWVGVARDDGAKKGEYSAIFFLKERFNLEDHGTFWLSETPEEKGSMGWDAACARIVTWARLTDKQSNKTFFMLNTHFDHRGVIAREESAKLLRSNTSTIAGDLPAVVTGDFNSTDTSAIYKTLTHKGNDSNLKFYLRDAFDISEVPPYGPEATFNGFGRITNGHRIDYIFVTENLRVLKHAIITDTWSGLYPSDHMPVLAEIIIQNTK